MKIAKLLPFLHAVKMEQAVFSGDVSSAAAHLIPVAIYSALATVVAVFCFLGQMKKQ